MTDTTIANVILLHLGGRRFLEVTGARVVMQTSTTVTFSLPANRTRNKANRVRVLLFRGTRFALEFSYVSGTDFTPRGFIYGLQAEQLLPMFETGTGIQVRVRK